MSVCHKCGKPVFLAEKRSSIGFDWHRGCLQCAECGKVLHPGQHAEHKGVPYCHIPCYSHLFGPEMFGHGTQVAMHPSFGNRHAQNLPVKREEIRRKLINLNQFYKDSGWPQLRCSEDAGRFFIEGPLRVHWGVSGPIHLTPSDNVPVPSRLLSYEDSEREAQKVACVEKVSSPNDDTLERILQSSDNEAKEENVLQNMKGSTTLKDYRPRRSKENIPSFCTATPLDVRHKSQTVGRRSGRAAIKKRYSINGHVYNHLTSVFVPPFATVTTIQTSSTSASNEVISSLLKKFKIENDPADFSLYVMWESGETRQIMNEEYPLISRILLGPSEEAAKIFIMEKNALKDIPAETAQYLSLSVYELESILHKFGEEEKKEEERIREKFSFQKNIIRLELNRARTDDERTKEDRDSEEPSDVDTDYNDAQSTSQRKPQLDSSVDSSEDGDDKKFYTAKSTLSREDGAEISASGGESAAVEECDGSSEGGRSQTNDDTSGNMRSDLGEDVTHASEVRGQGVLTSIRKGIESLGSLVGLGNAVPSMSGRNIDAE